MQGSEFNCDFSFIHFKSEIIVTSLIDQKINV